MDNKLTKEDIVTLINGIIDSKLTDFEITMDNSKKWRSFNSATDQYSPITGASNQIGFFGTPKITKPTVTGSRGANAALASLCTSLANLGLITNSTS